MATTTNRRSDRRRPAKGRLRSAVILAGLLALAPAVVGLSGPASPAAAAPAAAPASIHFTAAGDFDQTADTQGVLSGMAAQNPDFDLALGDLSYGAKGAEASWCNFVKATIGTTPFELIAGNHESNNLNGNITNFVKCLPNQLPGLVGTYGTEWYVDVPAAAPVMRIIMISPNLNFPSGTWQYTVGNAHYNWTAAAIDSAHAAGIPWVAVGMHEPCLSMTAADCSSGPDLMNLFVTKKVDLVMDGHVHMYERTKQLGYSATCPTLVPNTSSPGCIANSTNTMTQGAGTVFDTVGTGGEDDQASPISRTRRLRISRRTRRRGTNTWGYLDVTADTSHLTATFHATSGTPLTDTFTINRSTGPPANLPPVAAFSSPCSGLTCSFDGSASSDSDGSIVSSAWDFGDGSTGTGSTASHTYATAGTYSVSLTVTDDDGAPGSVTHPVTVSSGGGGGGISFVGAADATGGSVKVEQVTVPATTRTGDALVLFFSGPAGWTGPTGLTGWRQLDTFTSGSVVSTAWVKTAAATDPGQAIQMNNTAFAKGVLDLAVYRGVDPSTLTFAHGGDANKAAHIAPALSAPAGSWALTYWADKSAATTTWTPPTGVTTRDTTAGTGAGHFSSLLTDTAAPLPGGSYGPLTATADSTASNAAAWTLTLPASGAAPPPPSGISFVGAADATGGSVKVEQVTVPATTRTGDALVLFFSGPAGWTGPTGLTGWRQLDTFTSGSVVSTAWVKTAAATDPGQAIQMNNTAFAKGVLDLAVYRGVDPSTLTFAHGGDANKAAHIAPALSAPAGSWALTYWADKSAATTTWTPPTGVTTRATTAGTGAGHFSSLLTDTAAPLPGGSYGPLTATADSTASNAAAWTLTLPAA